MTGKEFIEERKNFDRQSKIDRLKEWLRRGKGITLIFTEFDQTGKCLAKYEFCFKNGEYSSNHELAIDDSLGEMIDGIDSGKYAFAIKHKEHHKGI